MRPVKFPFAPSGRHARSIRRHRSVRGRQYAPQHRPVELPLRHPVRWSSSSPTRMGSITGWTSSRTSPSFSNDPVNGDGIQQSDRRVMYGGDLGYKHAGRAVGYAQYRDHWVSNAGRRHPCATGDANDANADWDDHRQRYSGGVLCPVRQSGGAADLVDATGGWPAWRDLYV